MKTNHLHILHVLTFAPKYENVNDNLPPIKTWKNSRNEYLGIWKEDWAFVIGEKLNERFKDITFEILRVDNRADKIYTNVFTERLIYKSFPENCILSRYGIKYIKKTYSLVMEKYLTSILAGDNLSHNYILMIPAALTAFTEIFTNKFGGIIPIIHYHFTNNYSLTGLYNSSLNPIKALHRKFIAKQRMTFNQKIRVLQIIHNKFLEDINISTNYKFLNDQGLDINFWEKCISKSEARKILNIEQDMFIILLSSRLVKEYQIEETIKVLSSLKSHPTKFTAIFTGTGSGEYLKYLDKLVKNYNLENIVKFIGYQNDDKMKLWYTASDLFFMTSKANAGPVASYKALLMEVPVLSTNSGKAAEILEANNAGLLVPPFDYNQWRNKLIYALDGKPIQIVNLEKIKHLWNWDYICNQWMNIFHTALDDFHSRKDLHIRN